MFRIFAFFALVVLLAAPVHAGDFPGDPSCQSEKDCQGEDPGQEDPGQEDPGQEDPGQDDPGQEDPGQEDPGKEDPGQDDPGQVDPAPAPTPTPVPHQDNLCSGRFEGYYLDDPAPLSFKIRQNGQWGELQVTAWWRGGMWYGQGICRQDGPNSASIEIYFPGAPVHRGMIHGNGRHARMEGRIDFGRFFRLRRMR